MIWHISLDNNVKWSSHFPFLFINRLKIAWDRWAYLWSDLDMGLSHFINQITSLRTWMLNDYKSTKPCSAKSHNNGNQYSIHLHLCMMHRLLFHETLIVNEDQVLLFCKKSSFRNHSNMLIYYQYWKQLCYLLLFFYILFIYFGTRDTFFGVHW